MTGLTVAFGLTKEELKTLHQRANCRYTAAHYDKPAGVTGYEWFTILLEREVNKRALPPGGRVPLYQQGAREILCAINLTGGDWEAIWNCEYDPRADLVLLPDGRAEVPPGAEMSMNFIGGNMGLDEHAAMDMVRTITRGPEVVGPSSGVRPRP